MRKTYIKIVLLILTAFSSQAQDVSFTASAPETVQVGEQFRIIYEINDRINDFHPQQFNDFMYLSSQHGVSTVNWTIPQQYVYIFKTTKTSNFKIQAAKAKHKSKIIESNELEIEVVANAQTNQNSGSQSASSPKVSPNSSSGED